MDELTEGLEGTIGIADDLVVYGKTRAEYNFRLKALMLRCRATGIKLNPRKCKILKTEIPFYGLLIGRDRT
jgi:hypothetical protein